PLRHIEVSVRDRIKTSGVNHRSHGFDSSSACQLRQVAEAPLGLALLRLRKSISLKTGRSLEFRACLELGCWRLELLPNRPDLSPSGFHSPTSPTRSDLPPSTAPHTHSPRFESL